MNDDNDEQMALFHQLVVFKLDDQSYALRLPMVHEVVRMAEVTSVPMSPKVVLGVLNVRGEIIPVLSLRRRLDLPERECKLEDQLIIGWSGSRMIALVVDSVSGMIGRPAEHVTEVEKVVPGTEYLEGLVELDGHTVFIYNPDKLLSFDAQKQLNNMLTKT